MSCFPHTQNNTNSSFGNSNQKTKQQFLRRQSHLISSSLTPPSLFKTILTLSRPNSDFKSWLQNFGTSAPRWRTRCYPDPRLTSCFIFLSPCSSFFRCFTACRISCRWGSSSTFSVYRRKCFTVSESNTSGSTSTWWRRNILSQAMA